MGQETVISGRPPLETYNSDSLISARYGSGSGEVDEIRIDESTNSLQCIDYAHHEIHEGDAYRCFKNKDIANSESFNLAFTTPDTTKWVHFTFSVEHELQGDLKLYEGVTSWTGGAAATITNANRNSTATSGITDMATDVTVTLGTPIILVHEVGGSGKKSGSASNHDLEWVLKQNTTYYLVFANQAVGATNETNLQLDWYEHTDKH